MTAIAIGGANENFSQALNDCIESFLTSAMTNAKDFVFAFGSASRAFALPVPGLTKKG
jgi:hypothetical protein